MLRKVLPRRHLGACADCGGSMPVRTIHFWLNAMPYVVCAMHEREYTYGGRAHVATPQCATR